MWYILLANKLGFTKVVEHYQTKEEALSRLEFLLSQDLCDVVFYTIRRDDSIGEINIEGSIV